MSLPSSGFAVAVDLVVFTVRREVLHALVIVRGAEPYAGLLALPGGFVGDDEDLPTAAGRELAEETGLSAAAGHLEQLATYGAVNRDPRGRVVAAAYLALLPGLPAPRPGGDAAQALWRPATPLLRGEEPLAFDHRRILADGIERARSKIEYSSLAAEFCPPEFTIAQLRRIYEAVWGTRLDPRNFHRKVTGTPGFVVPTERSTDGERGRPARLYRAGPAKQLHPPLLRR